MGMGGRTIRMRPISCCCGNPHMDTHTVALIREHPTQYLNIHAYHKLNTGGPWSVRGKDGGGGRANTRSELPFSGRTSVCICLLFVAIHHSVCVYLCVSVCVCVCPVFMSFQPPSLGSTSAHQPPTRPRLINVPLSGSGWGGSGSDVAILCRIPWTLSPNRKGLCVGRIHKYIHTS